MHLSFTSLLLTLAIAPVALEAQQSARTISPGMTRAQVVSALGQPLTLRESDGYTYIFYRNQCTRACGMNDLVVLHADSVVDAIFRSSERHYTGTSSSPAPIPARVAARSKSPAVRPMKPAPPNDARPSIPVNPPKLAPAPTTTPTKKP